MPHILRSTAFVALIALCACVPTAKLAPTGAYNAAGYSVMLARPWNDVTPLSRPRVANVSYLTVDGTLLNRLYLASLQPSQALIGLPNKDTPRPLFRADMTESEAVEFVIDSMAAVGYQAPQATAQRPQNLGTHPGVRFDISTRTPEGLNITGTALVARAGETLHVLLFMAPSEHFYPAMAQEVDTMFANAHPRT
jgi:hypothetical protein